MIGLTLATYQNTIASALHEIVFSVICVGLDLALFLNNFHVFVIWHRLNKIE